MKDDDVVVILKSEPGFSPSTRILTVKTVLNDYEDPYRVNSAYTKPFDKNQMEGLCKRLREETERKIAAITKLLE